MRMIDLGSNAIYRYRVEIPRENKTPIDDLRAWLNETGITAAWVPGPIFFHDHEKRYIFFHEEQHAIHFILRWS